MNTGFEALTEYILTGITEGNLSDAAVYEFTEECCKNIQEEREISWTGVVEKLWDYLTVSRTALESNDWNAKSAFRQGQVFAALELVKMTQEKRESEFVLEQDARTYGGHWYPVFAALKSGKSLTHRELAEASGISDSSLSQFLHKIEQKRYVSSRKVGRTKYYRLSSRGRKLLKSMSKRRLPGEDFYASGRMQAVLALNAVRNMLKVSEIQEPLAIRAVGVAQLELASKSLIKETNDYMVPYTRKESMLELPESIKDAYVIS